MKAGHFLSIGTSDNHVLTNWTRKPIITAASVVKITPTIFDPTDLSSKKAAKDFMKKLFSLSHQVKTRSPILGCSLNSITPEQHTD